MLFLVAALMLLGVVLGTVAHAPLTFTAVAAVVIAAWLGVFALRERHSRRRTSAH
ncbi:UNVERIFIED_CONTAM: Flp pilus assembly protein TadB [Streptomyces canus]